MEIENSQSISTACAVLDRHDQHRRCGIPVVSVLTGPESLGLDLLRKWGDRLQQPMIHVPPDQSDPQSIVGAWLNELTRKYDLVDIAISWLARKLDRPADLLGLSLRAMTSYEVGVFLESALPLVSETGIELVIDRLIEHAADGKEPGDPALVPILNSALERFGAPWFRLFRAMGELLHQECLPILVVAPVKQDLAGLERVGRLLAGLATAQPRATQILLVEARAFDAYLAYAPPSRAKALLRESVITLVCTAPPTPTSPVMSQAESPNHQLLNSPEVANEDSRSHDLISVDDLARSAAERFLFERLESTPETAGLFELNALLGFHFGPNRLIEVDLAARSLDFAVEVDGYHHFQDPEAFRRDRRKDLELQKNGYLVARFLATDVVERLEDVMDTILKMVAFRRATAAGIETKP